ncbi:DUF5313 domain-containing protein [Mycolicibacterium sphagni]|uniref:DUF5313 domain-containing protein n=1 Tax=Mycolicibacterium sphagni TaxID=1786 RepID=A0A255DR35_9MYCO|nr:DUF5313 domain-containing protein [Mycolicibacterium sphagni]MCV7177653.1 DUF5313 domain-containing protein [Mycolicibacterium sphagni]OYN81141.1 hypothetical protein CG716_06250 [Mycolicibacterium sphagni]
MSDATRPNALQYIGYSYGKVLPPSMRDWVRNDLVGKGAQRRVFFRVAIPALLILAPLWLIPTTVYMHLAMTALLFVPCLYFTHALHKIYRAHRLRQHGLDPELVDEAARQRHAAIHDEYNKRYGPPQN